MKSDDKHFKPRSPDFILCLPIVCLVCFGLVMVNSASSLQSQELYGNSNMIFYKQLIALGVGMVAFVVGILFPHKAYRNPLVLYTAVAAVLGLLIAVKFQPASHGATRWFYLGPFGFQPSDLAKIVVIMFTAAYAAGAAAEKKPWRQRLIPIGVLLVVYCSLILWQPDFGTTMIIIFIVGLMLFLSGMPWAYLVCGGLLLLPMVVGLVMTQSYRLERIMAFRGGEEHYQIKQSKLALGSGGLTGQGLGQSKQKRYFLPEAHTDFIFATLGEELGLIGTLSVILCYLIFLLRGAQILLRVESLYSKVLGAGILLLIGTQAFMNISVALALFPNKGLTLPFMSAGGTSLILSLALCGILLNISRFQVVNNRVA